MMYCHVNFELLLLKQGSEDCTLLLWKIDFTNEYPSRLRVHLNASDDPSDKQNMPKISVYRRRHMKLFETAPCFVYILRGHRHPVTVVAIHTLLVRACVHSREGGKSHNLFVLTVS